MSSTPDERRVVVTGLGPPPPWAATSPSPGRPRSRATPARAPCRTSGSPVRPTGHLACPWRCRPGRYPGTSRSSSTRPASTRWSPPARPGPTPAAPTSTASGSGWPSPPASAGCGRCSSPTTRSRRRGPRRVLPITVPMLMPNGAAGAVAIEFGAARGAHSPVSACASGAEAIAYALDMIRTGRADIVIAGGTEAAIHPLPDRRVRRDARAVDPQRLARDRLAPLRHRRDGFVLGEGAGIVVLESHAHASRAGRQGLRRGGLGRSHLRRAPHRGARPRGSRRHPRDERGARPTAASTCPRWCTSTRTRPRPLPATSPSRPRSARCSASASARSPCRPPSR